MESKKKRGRPSFLTDSTKKRRIEESKTKHNKSRIFIGSEIDRWMSLKTTIGVKNHVSVAKYLLDLYCSKAASKTTGQDEFKDSDSDKAMSSTRSYEQKSGKHGVRFSNSNNISSALRKDTKSADIIFIIKDGAEVAAHKTILSLFSKALQENEVRK
ncbi:unnamed protein product [Owenia fusiformis]|uniref:BTB domain-containing protein n=1 Tax=Owenia fusiformis TaxID=6347 RepID=A0A8S4PQK7_OWEFU|nr:unnamed protein product [Owenia fusiformis]